jgi:hypothetical protein
MRFGTFVLICRLRQLINCTARNQSQIVIHVGVPFPLEGCAPRGVYHLVADELTSRTSYFDLRISIAPLRTQFVTSSQPKAVGPSLRDGRILLFLRCVAAPCQNPLPKHHLPSAWNYFGFNPMTDLTAGKSSLTDNKRSEAPRPSPIVGPSRQPRDRSLTQCDLHSTVTKSRDLP